MSVFVLSFTNLLCGKLGHVEPEWLYRTWKLLNRPSSLSPFPSWMHPSIFLNYDFYIIAHFCTHPSIFFTDPPSAVLSPFSLRNPPPWFWQVEGKKKTFQFNHFYNCGHEFDLFFYLTIWYKLSTTIQILNSASDSFIKKGLIWTWFCLSDRSHFYYLPH